MDWDILYKLCGSANKWSKGFVFSGKIFTAIRHVQSIIPPVRPRPNIRSHSVLFYFKVLYVINAPSINNLRIWKFIFTSIKCRIDLYKFYSGGHFTDTVFNVYVRTCNKQPEQHSTNLISDIIYKLDYFICPLGCLQKGYQEVTKAVSLHTSHHIY